MQTADDNWASTAETAKGILYIWKERQFYPKEHGKQYILLEENKPRAERIKENQHRKSTNPKY